MARDSLSGPTGGQTAARSIGATVVLVGSAVEAGQRRVIEVEEQVFRAINSQPHRLTNPMWVVMQAGSLAGGLAISAAAGRALQDRRTGISAAAGAFIAWLGAKGTKLVIGRARPEGFFHDIDLRRHAPGGGPYGGDGYVSGHTAVAFAWAVVVADRVPRRWRWAPWAIASTVGVARMYYGAHLPLDVVGGAALGVLAGSLTDAAAVRILPAEEAVGEGEGLTGPEPRVASSL